MLLIVTAAAAMIPGVSLPFDLAAQARVDRIYYAQFQHAAAYMQRTGHPPERASDDNSEGASIYPVLANGSDCGPSFQRDRSDRFVLSFWRGEWTECYAFPSGRTTLPMSVIGYLREGLWWLFVGCWAVALAAIWGAVRLTRGLRPA